MLLQTREFWSHPPKIPCQLYGRFIVRLFIALSVNSLAQHFEWHEIGYISSVITLFKRSLNMKPVLLLIAAVLCINGTLSAIPSLQLDLKNGSYSNETETIITNESLFTLYGYGKSSIDISKDYLLSIAIIPSVLPSEVDWGSFTVNETLEYFVPIDLNFGTPPLTPRQTRA